MINRDFIARIGADEQTVERALRLHREAIVIDGSSVVYGAHTPLDTQWDRYSDGGVTATNHTVTTPDVGLQEALVEVNEARRWIESNADKVMLCTSADDVREAKRKKLGGVIFGPQDTKFLGKELNNLGTFYDLGVRVLQLTYQKRNYIGDGCGEPAPGKLSDFGRVALKEMQQMGYLVDVSHTSEATSFDVVERAEKPVVLTHAHPTALTPTIRSKSDDMLKAIAATGGTVGITALSMFTRLQESSVRPTLEDYITHIDYLVDLIGIDHVAIASDFDEITSREEYAAIPDQDFVASWFGPFGFDGWMVDGYSRASETPGITLGLIGRGYDDESIKKILGENFMRAMTEAGCS